MLERFLTVDGRAGFFTRDAALPRRERIRLAGKIVFAKDCWNCQFRAFCAFIFGRS